MSNNSMTSEPTTPNHIQQTLFVGDFLAKTSAKPDCRPVSPKKLGQACFSSSCESFAWFDQNTLSWKTSQRSFLTGWESYSESWPRQGMTQNMLAYQQVLWEPAIKETDFGLSESLPTPVARDYKGRTSKRWNERYGPKVLPDVLTQIGDNTKVNPCWLEEAMGYPIGYTELKR